MTVNLPKINPARGRETSRHAQLKSLPVANASRCIPSTTKNEVRREGMDLRVVIGWMDGLLTVPARGHIETLALEECLPKELGHHHTPPLYIYEHRNIYVYWPNT